MFSIFLSIAVINTDLEKEGFSSSYNSQVILHHREKSGQELRAGTWRQELKPTPWRVAAYWLDLPSLFSLLSYVPQDDLPMVDTSYSGLGFLILTINPQTGL